MTVKAIGDDTTDTDIEAVASSEASNDTSNDASSDASLQAAAEPLAVAPAQASGRKSWGGWKWVSLVLAILLLIVMSGGGWELGSTTATAVALEERVVAINDQALALQRELASLQVVADELAELTRNIGGTSRELAALSAPDELPSVAAAPPETTTLGEASMRARDAISDAGRWVSETADSTAKATRELFAD